MSGFQEIQWIYLGKSTSFLDGLLRFLGNFKKFRDEKAHEMRIHFYHGFYF